jgi:hypothetical protein
MSDCRSTTSPSAGSGGSPAGSATATCPPGQCPPMEIEINDTPAINDDLVELKCEHPSHRNVVNCRIRATSTCPTSSTVVLTNPDGRLRFPNAADTTTTVTVPGDGSWAPFQISGENPSNAIADAVIEAHCNTATGEIKARKGVTVFWFDQAQIVLTAGGNYALVGNNYTVPGNVAVSFSAQARIRPSGVDCSAPQVTNLRVGIMQESSNFRITTTWDTPTIVWVGAVASGTTVTVPTTQRETTTYDPSVSQPVNDGLAGAYPLYSTNATALKPPMGCTGGGAATSNDTPGQGAQATFVLPVRIGGAVVGTVTWSRRVNTTRTENFRTFCVIYDTTTNQYCALREARWSVNADSAAAGPQTASVNADAAASVDPATGVQANNALNATTTSSVGGATTTFVKP